MAEEPKQRKLILKTVAGVMVFFGIVLVVIVAPDQLGTPSPPNASLLGQWGSSNGNEGGREERPKTLVSAEDASSHSEMDPAYEKWIDNPLCANNLETSPPS